MITIFTPTYNREKLLKRLYESLCNQTNKKFKWLVVDDGSTDTTKKWINKIKDISPFEIIYHYQQNGGKHRAYNAAVKLCTTDYFFILDSDDCLSNETISTLEKYIKQIDNLDTVCGIIGNKFDMKTSRVIGNNLPNIKYCSGIELYQKYNFKGDTLRLYKTKILKEYLFPEILNEKFIYENVVFDKIDQKYKFLLIKEKLYYCEYQKNGYSNNSNTLKLNNPIGYSLSLKSASETAINIKKKVGWTILYIIWCNKMHIHNKFKCYKNKILYIILSPIALIFYIMKIPKFFFNIFK